MKTHRLRAYLTAACLTAGFSAIAHADEIPEILLLLDTSSNMELAIDSDSYPDCESADVTMPDREAIRTGRYGVSKMSAVQDALAGSRVEGWCRKEDRSRHSLGDDGTPHFRSMCRNLGGDFAPCGNDHGKDDGEPDATKASYGVAFSTDGFIYRNRTKYRFSFMTLDSNPEADSSPEGQYSYGDELMSVSSSDYRNALYYEDRNVSRVNLGARNQKAQFGGLVRGGVGTLRDPEAEIEDEAGAVESHNLYVLQQIRNIVPLGRAALSPLLHDAKEYVKAERESISSMGVRGACRNRAVILITQGTPGWFFDTPCNGCSGPCSSVLALDGSVQSVCHSGHDEGYPYEPSAKYANQLRDMGVPVFVIAVSPNGEGVEYAQKVAHEGSPNMGVDESDGFYIAKSAAEISEALDRVANTLSKGTYSQTRPIILAPSAGDTENDEDIRQWRISSYYEMPGDGDAANYGQVDEQRLGCHSSASQNSSGALISFATRKYADELAREDTRYVVAENPEKAHNVIPVMGESESLFDHWNGLGGLWGADQMMHFLMQPNESALKQMAIRLNGFFGRRGLSHGLSTSINARKRQLGEISAGEMVAILPPNIGLETAAARTYEKEYAKRPTMVAQGARDGLIHVFRADDGRELVNFMPRMSLTHYNVSTGFNAEAKMSTGSVAVCRSVTTSPSGDCPSDSSQTVYRTQLVGALNDSSNLFGITLDGLGSSAIDFDQLEGGSYRTQVRFPEYSVWNVTQDDVPNLGETTSRPVLTHVRENGRVRAAVIAGCGGDLSRNNQTSIVDGVGRCVLVLDAMTGKVIREFHGAPRGNQNDPMDYPFVGSPAVWPSNAMGTADRAYIGDSIGRLWRLDLRDQNPEKWSAKIVWPPESNDVAYKPGRALVDRPSLVENDRGELVIVFANGSGDANTDAFVVSLTEHATIDASNDSVEYKVTENWTFPLANREEVTGPTVVRSGVVYFTTLQTETNNSCATRVGRLFGVDYMRTYLSSNGEEATYRRQGKTVNVLPKLALGDNTSSALAVVLPSDRIAYGVTLISTPSCRDDEEPSTDMILDLNDSGSSSGTVNTESLAVETVGSGQVSTSALGDRMYAEGNARSLTLSTERKPDGSHKTQGGDVFRFPFPGVTTYWGGVLAE